MTTHRSSLPGAEIPDDGALKQAAEWFACREGGWSAEESARCRQWVQADPSHETAWRQVESIWASLGGLSPAAAQALDEAGRKRRTAMVHLGSSVAAAALVLLGLRIKQEASRPVHAIRSMAGHTLQHSLPDGGQLWLNSGSEVIVGVTPGHVDLVLLHGELLLQTGRSAACAHTLRSRHGRLHTRSARLSVSMHAGRSRADVFSGTASWHAPFRRPLHIHAGQALEWNTLTPPAPRTADSMRGNWQTGELAVRDAALPAVIAELARYGIGRLDCDRQLADLKVTAVLPRFETEAALQLLAHALPIRIVRHGPWWMTVQSR